MAFNKPRNSQNDKSGRSSSRTTSSADRPKISPSARGKSSTGFNKTDKNPTEKKYGSDRGEEKRSFSAPGSKSYGDKNASSFIGGEKKTFKPKGRPYTGRPADAGESGGDKKAFTPRSRPYTGRVTDNDARPAKSFGGGDKKPFQSRGKASEGSSFNDRPKRSYGSDTGGEKKSFQSRGKSSEGSSFGDRPKRAASGERPARLTTGGFKKRDTDKSFDDERPQRAKSSYDKITPDRDAPAKTLRGRKKPAEKVKDDGLIRLNRYISNAGICSRRKADELIAAGVVSVNGEVINELGHKIDPFKDEIRYNGELLKREKMVYVLLNKPKDYITTTEDPQERRTVMHLVEKASKERIYPVGRLDRNTTGLLLMTNDGDLADKLSHPRNNIVKLYQVELNKSLTQGDMNKIGFGLDLEDGLIKPDSISYVAGGSKREIGIQIHSGKNRIVRRIFESLGYEVVKLDRAVYANLTKKDLPRGRWRFLEEKEVIQLKHLIQG
jgi:23S rRNA pseudouridine2605 synthase